MNKLIKQCIAPIFIFLIFIAGTFILPSKNKITISAIYAEPMTSNKATAYWDITGNGLSDQNGRSAQVVDWGTSITLTHNVDEIKQLGFLPTDGNEICGISQIAISVNDGDALVIPASEIDSYFTACDAICSYDSDANSYYFLPGGEHPALVMNSEIYQSITKNSFDEVNSNLLRTRGATGLIVSILLFLLIFYWKELGSSVSGLFEDQQNMFVPIAVILFLISAVTVWVIAFKSELGVHPDEYDVVACLKYGMTHFFPPDIRDAEVAYTFSGYGYTKLENTTYYFLIAGKVALLAKWLFSQINWFRVPNVLLFIGMGIIYIKNINKKQWLTLALGVSVQAWYIFSYTTADALDFFWSFLVLIQLTDEDSWLNSLINTVSQQKKLTSKDILKALTIAILFGMVFLGKQNYWITLVLTFVILLSKLLKAEGKERTGFIKLYLLILAMFAITVATRYAFDFAHYGTNGSEIKAELDAKYADYDKNPTTPASDLCTTYRMAEHGYSVADLFVESPNWFKHTFHSFTGLVTDRETPYVYYALMGVLYILILFMIAQCSLSSDNKQKLFSFWICFAILALNVIISIFNSYISDSQAQGRYLLPMTFVLSYMGYQNKELFENKLFRYSVLAINILSVWYFATSGIKLTGVTSW